MGGFVTVEVVFFFSKRIYFVFISMKRKLIERKMDFHTFYSVFVFAESLCFKFLM